MSSYMESKFSEPQRKRKGFYYECEICKKMFYVNPARIRQTEAKGVRVRFCSLACYGEGKKGEGNPYWGKKHSDETIRKMLEHPNRYFFPKGSENYNYLKPHKPKVGATDSSWRSYLLIVRGAACERCGYSEYPRILQIHHKDRNRKHNSEDNLIILCPNCHHVDHLLGSDGPYKPARPRAHCNKMHALTPDNIRPGTVGACLTCWKARNRWRTEGLAA
jgi:5-methylcytosine-specific restriction endonuclease McrA